MSPPEDFNIPANKPMADNALIVILRKCQIESGPTIQPSASYMRPTRWNTSRPTMADTPMAMTPSNNRPMSNWNHIMYDYGKSIRREENRHPPREAFPTWAAGSLARKVGVDGQGTADAPGGVRPR